MIDFDGLLYAPLYDAFGVSAVITSVGGIVTEGLTVIDKTAGVAIDEGNGLSFATTKPAACIRASELTSKNLTRAGIKQSTIEFNGGAWTIIAIQPKPNPSGDGELYLILQEA